MSVDEIYSDPSGAYQSRFAALRDRAIQFIPIDPGFPYVEPDDTVVDDSGQLIRRSVAKLPKEEEPQPAKPDVALLFPELMGYKDWDRDKLVATVEQMALDWVSLNSIHNFTAERNQWCGDYEDRQRKHNREFKILELKPRSSAVERGAVREPYNRYML